MCDERLSVKAKGLYAYLVSYCGAGDRAFPRREHALFHLGISEPTYYKVLEELQRADYVRVSQGKAGGRFTGNTFVVNEFPRERKGEVVDKPVALGAGKKADKPMAKGENQTGQPTRSKEEKQTASTKKDGIPKGLCSLGGGLGAEPSRSSDGEGTFFSRQRKWDIGNGDAEIADAYITTSFLSNSYSNDRSARRVRGLAEAALRRRAPERATELAEVFLPRFLKGVRGKEVRNLPSYVNAAVVTFLREREAGGVGGAEPGRASASYDLREIEEWIEAGAG
jgi:hypothetical protein